MAITYRRGWVYFVCRRSDPTQIKIGFTTDPRGRFTALELQLAEPISVLGLYQGRVMDEASEHLTYDRDALGFEWFSASEELLEHIEETTIAPLPTVEGPVIRLRLTTEQQKALLSLRRIASDVENVWYDSGDILRVALECLWQHKYQLPARLRALRLRPYDLAGTELIGDDP